MEALLNRIFALLILTLSIIVNTPALEASASPEESSPIVIGAPLATSFLYGWGAERGMRLAAQEINKAGGVQVGDKKRRFRIEVMDTRDLEPGVPVNEALLAVEKLILEKKADFIVGGPIRSEAALAAMPLLAKHQKVSILSCGSLSPRYSEIVAENPIRYKYCFRITGDAQWMALGEVVPCLEGIGKKYGLDRLFIMVQDVAHARTGGEIIRNVMSQKGWKIIGDTVVVPTGATDFSVGLSQAKNGKAQVMLIWMDMPESAVLLKQWYDNKVPALPFGVVISAAEQPGFWESTDGKGEYCMASVTNAGNAPSDATPWTMKFVNAYKEKYGVAPECYGASSSYMALYVLKDAIERAGKLDSDAVVKALRLTDLMGVYGRIRFDPVSNQVIPSLDPEEGAVGTIFQWQDKERIVVFPPTIANGEVKLPPWMEQANNGK
jgi:branched-chain amino acid transport system substrate-binding protein